MKIKYILVSLFLFFKLSIVISQTVSGIVLDAENNEPIIGASVYFDNTSFGSSTNFNGVFSFELKKATASPLIISFLGYKTITLYNVDFNKKHRILLERDINALQEVVIDSKDEWSREFKLKQFRREFLGRSKFGKACVILNEKDIILNFEIESKQLVAAARVPILIKNNALDYIVRYDLNDFYINYNIDTKSSLDLEQVFKTVASVFYSGTTFFEETISKKHRKALKNRREAFIGSTLHFMRAVANNKLKEEKFKVFKGSYQTDPSLYIKTYKNDSLNVTDVEILIRLNLLCKGKQSAIKSEVKRFQIDEYGNHSPIDKVLFGGFMGDQRMGDALPLDYGL